MFLRTQRTCIGATLLALAALITVGATTSAAEETRTTSPTDLVVELPFGGMTVAIDPVTGQLRPPTPAQALELAQQMRAHFGQRAGEPVRVMQHRDGMLSAVLSPEDMDFSVATLDAQGGIHFQCVDKVDRAAVATLTAPALEEM